MISRAVTDTENVVVAEGDLTSYTATFNESDISKVFSILSSLYKDTISSVVREITSNCFDSHLEAEVEDAVHIRLVREKGKWFIEFEDFGVGLSPDRIESVFRQFGKSTKEQSKNALGMWGLGSKSPLSYYTRSFEIITRFAGIEYNYLMYSKIGALPIIELLSEETTQKRNGTTIKIVIKDGDLDKWKEALKSALCYFENIIFNYECYVDNNFTIYEGKNFKFRFGNTYSRKIHLINGCVAYPIDFDIIDINQTLLLSENLPIGIKFEVGELMVIPSREDIDYNDEVTKNLIIDRINAAVKELKEMFRKQNQVTTTDNFWKYYEERKIIPKFLYFDKAKSHYIEIISIFTQLEREQFAIKYKPFEDLGVPFSEELYNRLLKCSSVLVQKKRKHTDMTPSYKQAVSYNWDVFLLDEERNKLKDKFLLWSSYNNVALFRYHNWDYLPKKSQLGTGRLLFNEERKFLVKELKLERQLKITEKIRKAIEVYQATLVIKKYSDVVLTERFHKYCRENKIKKGKTEVSKEQVFLNSITNVFVGSSEITPHIHKDAMYLHQWRKIAQRAVIVIYGAREDKEALSQAYALLNCLLPYKKNITQTKHQTKKEGRYMFRVEYLAQNYVKKFKTNQFKEEMENVFNINEFPIRHPVISKIATAHFIRKSLLFRLIEEAKKAKVCKLDRISLTYTRKLKELWLEIKDIDKIDSSNKLGQEVYKLIVEHKFFDQKLIDMYNECTAFFNKIPLVYSTIENENFEEEILPLIIQQMKDKKMPLLPRYVNWTSSWFGNTPPIPYERQLTQGYPSVPEEVKNYNIETFKTDNALVYLL